MIQNSIKYDIIIIDNKGVNEMSKLNKIANIINLNRGAEEFERAEKLVNNSKITQEEKERAFKARNKMLKFTIIFVISVFVIAGIITAIGFSISSEVGFITVAISMLLTIVVLVACLLNKNKIKAFSDWTNTLSKVEQGFDGLSDQEINRLKHNDKEQNIIKKYKKKIAVCVIIFLVALALEFVILLNLGLSVYSLVTIIITFVIVGIFYVKIDSYDVEIHRIQTGYYKKSFGYLCQKCKSEVRMNFEDIEKLDSLPRNEQGIRVVNCHNCGNPVPFYNADNTLKDYKKYLEEIK